MVRIGYDDPFLANVESFARRCPHGDFGYIEHGCHDDGFGERDVRGPSRVDRYLVANVMVQSPREDDRRGRTVHAVLTVRALVLAMAAAFVVCATVRPAVADTFAASDAQVLSNATFFQGRHWSWKGRIAFYDAGRVPAILRAYGACSMTPKGATWYFGVVDGSRTQSARFDFRPQLLSLNLLYDAEHLSLSPLNGSGATYSKMDLGCPGTPNGSNARVNYVLVLDNVYIGNRNVLSGDFARF